MEISKLKIQRINLLIKINEEILNFISMGGHSFYIWTAYFIPLILIFSFVIILRSKLKRIKKHEAEV